ncbi:MAG: hypothetical protein J0H82_23015 [Alphaproteobacteria bacterium]|jgi:hypothetical protein|nr:hypothetical protein [Alphaproteobacteria bacterium]
MRHVRIGGATAAIVAGLSAGAAHGQGNPNAFPPTTNQLTAAVVPGASCTGAGMVTIINLSSAVMYNNPAAPAYGLVNADRQTQVVGGIYNDNNASSVGMSVPDGITSDTGLPLAVGPGKTNPLFGYANMFGVATDPTAGIDPAKTLPIAAYPLITTFNKGTTPQSSVQNATGYEQYMGYSLGTNLFLGIPYCSVRATGQPSWVNASNTTSCPKGTTQQTAVWQLGLMNVTNPPNNAQYITYTHNVSIFTRVMNAMTMVAGIVAGFFDAGVQFGADMIGAIAGGAGSFQKNTNMSAQTRPAYYGQTYMSLYSSYAADRDGNALNNQGSKAGGLFTNQATGTEIGGSGISQPFGATPPPNAFALRFSTAGSRLIPGSGQSTTVMLQTMANDALGIADPVTGNAAASMTTCPAGWLMTIWDSVDFDSCVTAQDPGGCTLGQMSWPANPFN